MFNSVVAGTVPNMAESDQILWHVDSGTTANSTRVMVMRFTATAPQTAVTALAWTTVFVKFFLINDTHRRSPDTICRLPPMP
jgi:hypothetical protein